MHRSVVITFALAVITFLADVKADKLVKCCEEGFVVDVETEDCVPRHLDRDAHRKIMRDSGLQYDVKLDGFLTCSQGSSSSTYSNDTTDVSPLSTSCLDLLTNNSLIYLNCSSIIKQPRDEKCDSIFKLVYIYGASMMIFANMIYITIYLIVCLMYACKPNICRRAYDKAVLLFTASQILISCEVIFCGFNFLCHKTLSDRTFSLLGILFMILIISSCFWLLIISFDVASTITRISWAPSSGAKKSDENHKFKVYLSFVIIGTIIPTAISSILEFLPLPEDHILKPQFYRMTSVNYRVLVHVAIVPVCIGIASNTLFIYTSLKMISIRRSAKFANENRKNKITQRYILYLKLYLFMDAPYITGALGSAFENLWILKFSRLIQPVLMLYAVLPREMTANLIPCKKKSVSKSVRERQKSNNALEHS